MDPPSALLRILHAPPLPPRPPTTKDYCHYVVNRPIPETLQPPVKSVQLTDIQAAVFAPVCSALELTLVVAILSGQKSAIQPIVDLAQLKAI